MSEPYDRSPKPISREPFTMDRSDPAFAGQSVYTPGALRAYDTVVVRLSNSLVWRCAARRILRQYNRHVTTSHLDVGPGTGYYLDRCRFPGTAPHLTLLDPNPDVLRFAGHRLRRYRPTSYAADVLKPVGLEPASYRSVALSYVLHCLPGDIRSKATVFDHLIPLVEPGGVVFGSTILNGGVRHTRLGRALLRVYNGKGIFSNLHDDLDGLEEELASRFGRYELEVSGAVALFAGWLEPPTQ
ncbi:class I SAM-dependent methyltransferase [Phytoactinopolyspora endophytica]|uniref:class I SAM-dependent methyltransferase n=1 Tax=Phytoactinopolyspora endophytica TaxID=1642495 RepID=UPI00197B7FC5|nr:class I SAM-dependent methyltransferase [Phytoactinopolyspora endophytica]